MKHFFSGLGVLIVAYLWIAIFDPFECGACLQQQDYEFMDRIQSHVEENGGLVKVSDIHPGDWKEVCVTKGGINYNLSLRATPESKEKSPTIIINKADPYITEAHDESAISFHYGKANDHNLVELYQMTPDKMVYLSQGKACFAQSEAYMRVKQVQNPNNTTKYMVVVTSKAGI